MDQKNYKTLLREKAQYFKDLFGMTKKFLNYSDREGLELGDIDKFLKDRQKIIRQIQELDQKLASKGKGKGNINRDIADISRKLVDFDDRIFKILSEKKEKIIKDFKKTNDIKNRNSYKKGNPKKLVDIEG
ncbi:MAG: hypothetical protein K9M80_02640 [Candidatus Marinimicrobia bacterium]|nr:hypothetical protein [Candidatus Neomarinimicrobiota bacterium]